MKKSILVICVILMISSSCTTTPDLQQIRDLPSEAKEVLTLTLDSDSGDFTKGKIEVSGNGYLVMDIKLQKGSIKTLELKSVTLKKETIHTISKPQTALYDSPYYEYSSNSEYAVSFGGAKNVKGTIVVYFVKDVS